jgi:hypothetical protein
MSIASEMSQSDVDGDLKGKNGFPFSLGPDGRLQHPAVGEIDRGTENIRQPHFKAGHVENRKVLGPVEITHQVHIRLRCRIPARHRPKNGQTHDSGGL